MSKELIREAPAKLNLFFEVLGKRPDGYHEILSLACPVSLCDTLGFLPDSKPEIEFVFESESGFSVTEDIPRGSENLAVRALSLLREKYGITSGGRLRLVKRIPSQAGLGGGSSDAASALSLGNEAWNLGLDCGELAAIGAELGSDVPLFFAEGPVLCRGRGEIIEPVRDWPRLHFVLLKPPAGLSTAKVYAAVGQSHDREIRAVEPVLEAIRQNDLPLFGTMLFNRLEEAAASIWPDFQQLRDSLRDCDCPAVRMSGSGTTFFGLCRDQAHAETAAAALRGKKLGNVFAVSSYIVLSP